MFNKNRNKNKFIWPTISVVVIVLIVSVFFMPFSQKFLKYISAKISQFATVISSSLVLGTNEFRVTNNESALKESSLLNLAAQMKADDMAGKGYFSHVAPNGDLPWVWFNKVGYDYSYAGENLAIDFTESSDITTAWINSAKHKANLLNANFTEIGIGIATGTYEGHATTFVVQFFAKPYINTDVATVGSIIKTEKLSTTTKSDVAVVTRSDLPSGEVLGATTENNNQNGALLISGVLVLIIVVISLKLFSNRKEKQKTI